MYPCRGLFESLGQGRRHANFPPSVTGRFGGNTYFQFFRFPHLYIPGICYLSSISRRGQKESSPLAYVLREASARFAGAFGPSFFSRKTKIPSLINFRFLPLAVPGKFNRTSLDWSLPLSTACSRVKRSTLQVECLFPQIDQILELHIISIWFVFFYLVFRF